MRTSWLIALFSILFLSNAYLLFQHFTGSSQEIVYVDSAKLMNGYQGMIDARKAYQQKAAVWKANVDTLVAEIQKDIMSYEKESAKMSAKERELTKQIIQNKQQQLGDYQNATNDKAAQEDAQLTKQVVDEVNAFIKAYGIKHKYLVILAANEYGSLAYAKDGIDITDTVLEGLNKKYRGE